MGKENTKEKNENIPEINPHLNTISELT